MTHASVFSGIGGPEVAASMLGWENLFHCEINPFGRAVLDYWYPEAESYEDITKTDFRKWRGQVNVLTGGFPCQPFSVAGKRRGEADDRYLWPHMHRCINEVQPDWVLCENVAGILTMVEQGRVSEVAGQAALFDEGNTVHRYEYRATFTLERICRDLEADGYSVRPVLIPACAVGAPHRRDRVFVIGRRADADTAGCGSTSQGKDATGNRQGAEIVSGQAGRGERHAPVGHHGLSSVQGTTADTDGGRLSQRMPGRGGEDSAQNGTGVDDSAERPCYDGAFGRREDYIYGERWENFPAQPPVCRGDDGLSVPPHYDTIFQTRNNMDRNSVIQGALSTGKIEVDFETGNIYSSRIRGHEGTKMLLNGSECNGYVVHSISFNGIKKQCRAHQIVWIAANGLYDKDKYQIDHINRNRKDNRLCNLRLVTAADNIANSDRPDTRMFKDEERCKIWQTYNEGHMSIREIAEDYGVSKSYIHKIVSEFPDLTIPFPRWRKESIKAFGNAIVPQVMYELFRAIELTERETDERE